MDTTKAITHIGLCAGYGGIELGLKRVLPTLRSVALCEIEAFAIANLVSKMEAGLMDPAPIWPNLKTFPWAAFRDRVDILTGGYPCQGFSHAGLRKGKQDPRHLWPWIADGIRLLRPRICFFENVEGHISLGLSDVIEDLAGMGYRTTWGIFSASEVGAPHQRKRVFILAVASGFRGTPGLSGSFTRHEGQSGEFDDGGGEVMADAQLHGCNHAEQRPHADGVQGSLGKGNEHRQALRDGEVMADSECSRSSTGRSDARRQEVSQSEHCNLWPSRPGEQQYGWEPPRVVLAHSSDNGCASGEAGGDVCGEQSDTRRQEESSSVEQSAGSDSFASLSGEAMADSYRIDRSAPAEGREHDRQAGSAGEELGDSQIWDGEGKQVHIRQGQGEHRGASGSECSGRRQTQPPLGGDADGSASGLDYAQLCVTCDNRTDELRLLGNGVVPATAERAFRTLIKELDDSENRR